jgi:GntR family transcriptional regulator
MENTALVMRLAGRLRDGGSEPVAHLVVEELWLAVVDGSLDSGQRLPTARELAIALNVSPRSIERAYDELQRRGVTVTRPGAGTFVSLQAGSPEELQRHRRLAELCRDTVQHAEALGFDIDQLVDALVEYRTARDDHATETS